MAGGRGKYSSTGAILRNAALWVFALTAIIAWLPFVRATIEPDYAWGTSYFGLQFSGAGLTGDYWLIAALAALSATLLYFGFRNPGAGFYRLFALVLAANAASHLYSYAVSPGGLVFRGDTLGVEIDLGLSAFFLYAGVLFATLFASALEGARRRPRFVWGRLNAILFALALALLPAQIWLLRAGEQHARFDEIGVLLTMAQWLCLAYAFAANRRRPA